MPPSGALLALVLAATGCSLQSSAIAPSSGMDGGGDAVLPDVPVPDVMIDAGPPCREFSASSRVVAVVAGEALHGAAGVVFDGTVVEEPGNVALRANRYRRGGWAFIGHDEPLLSDPPNLADLDGSTPVAAAFRNDLDESLSAGEAPHDLLVDRDDQYTIEVVGELRLATGETTIHLEADDRAVFTIEVDGATIGLRRAGPGSTEMIVTTPTAGWYPIRGAWQNTGGPGRFRLEVTPPDGSRRGPGVDELRVDALALEGREAIGWEAEEPSGPPLGSRIDLDETDWSDGSGPYPGVGIDEDDHWAARWFGRFVFPDPIDDVRMRTNESHRLWVDGVFIGGAFGGALDARYATPAPDGLIDVVHGLTERTGDSEVRFELDEDVFPVERLRPATRFGGTPFGRGETFSHSVSGSRTETLDLSGVPGEPPSAVEVSVVIEADEPEMVMVSVTEPGGLMHTQPLEDASWSRRSGTWLLRWVPPWASTLDSAAGVWEITVDNSASDSVTWSNQGVLAHVGGVAEPYPRSGSFISGFIDLGDETEVTGVRAGGMWNGLSDVRFAMRAAPTPREAAVLPFVDADAAGDLASAITGRFVQVRITMEGPGWDTPRVRDLRVLGRSCRRCAEVDPTTCPEERVAEDLVGLWTFGENGAPIVRDLSGFRVHDLITPSRALLTWETGYVNVEDGRFTVDRPVHEITDAIVATGALSLEAWVRPANDTQDGPARILTISDDRDDRNLTLGQEGRFWEGRVRRVGDIEGFPYFESRDPSVTAGALQHVVLTRESDGTVQIWVDGSASGDPQTDEGALTNWDRNYRLYVANEGDDTRQWEGEIHLVALYRRALTAAEIARHHRIGPDPP